MEEAINSYLTFMINGGLYGIHVSKVVEIMAYETPQAQTTGLNYMLGFVQHRGRVLPLIDSGLKFGQKPIELTPQSYVVVIAVRNADETFEVALAVDQVRQVVDIQDDVKSQIETSYKPGYVLFAAKTDDGLGLFLDADKVFADTDVISMAELMAQANKTA